MVRTDRQVMVVAKVVIVLAAATLLAACTSSDSGGVKSFLTGGYAGTDQPDDLSPEFFRTPAYCPPIKVRGETGIIIVYERGHDSETSFVQHQGLITKTARECIQTNDGLSIKVGIAGRVVVGPKGGPGTVTMPIRIAVSRDDGSVLYSELFKVPVTMASPNLNTDFSKVVPQVAVPVGAQERDITVYVGFDEGKAG